MNNLKKLCAAAFAAACLMLARGAAADDLESLIRLQVPSASQYVPIQSGARSHANTASSREISRNEADDLIRSAMGLLGVAYRYGGSSARTGFDCSGFMQHIFSRSMQISLPRRSADQAKMGEHVSRSNLQPGDMVFFRTMGGGRISHVGLYIGNDRFIHAPRAGKRIEITSLSNKYWNAKYATARRVKKNDPSRFLN